MNSDSAAVAPAGYPSTNNNPNSLSSLDSSLPHGTSNISSQTSENLSPVSINDLATEEGGGSMPEDAVDGDDS